MNITIPAALALAAVTIPAPALARDRDAPAESGRIRDVNHAIETAELATARGTVFLDANNNQQLDRGERGLPGIRVSNGQEVVETDDRGRYELPVHSDDEIIFVIKPRDHRTHLDHRGVPRFYYVHKPAGSPPLEFAGVLPTGPLPETIDFPLYESPEQSEFRVILIGDPQPRNMTEVDYLARGVASDLAGNPHNAAFVVPLGDIAFDNLDTLEPWNDVMAAVGTPVYNVLGNHDINFDVTSDEMSDETWERIYGPPTFSFDYAGTHWIVIDDVYYEGDVRRGQYSSSLSDKQLEFIKNDLSYVDKDTLIAVVMHIPLTSMDNREDLFELLAPYPHTFSAAAHWHVSRHFDFGSGEGWTGEGEHHHLVTVTACGDWFKGDPDEHGVPQSVMRDGVPKGYMIMTIDGTDYSLRYQGIGLPEDEQMNIMLPMTFHKDAAATEEGVEVVVNFYAGDSKSSCKLRIADHESESGWSEWIDMTKQMRRDPEQIMRKATFSGRDGLREPSDAVEADHIWVATLPADIPAGSCIVEVLATDRFGQEFTEQRVVRVTE